MCWYQKWILKYKILILFLYNFKEKTLYKLFRLFWYADIKNKILIYFYTILRKKTFKKFLD